ncbi:MAG: hypothetical protein AAFN77_09095 [Planctomycetota bacterium]
MPRCRVVLVLVVLLTSPSMVVAQQYVGTPFPRTFREVLATVKDAPQTPNATEEKRGQRRVPAPLSTAPDTAYWNGNGILTEFDNSSQIPPNVYRKPTPAQPIGSSARDGEFDRSDSEPPKPTDVELEPPAISPSLEGPANTPTDSLKSPFNLPNASFPSRTPVSVLDADIVRRGPVVENLSDSLKPTLASRTNLNFSDSPVKETPAVNSSLAGMSSSQSNKLVNQPVNQRSRQSDNRSASQVSNPTLDSQRAGQQTAQAPARRPVNVDPTPASMKVRLLAPEVMLASQPNELAIEVLNLSTAASTPVKVKVAIPDDLTITRFDRDAWLDEKSRTITFSINSIPGRYKQTIRLKGVSHSTGQHQVQVAVFAEENLIDQSALALGVIAESALTRNATAENAAQGSVSERSLIER